MCIKKCYRTRHFDTKTTSKIVRRGLASSVGPPPLSPKTENVATPTSVAQRKSYDRCSTAQPSRGLATGQRCPASAAVRTAIDVGDSDVTLLERRNVPEERRRPSDFSEYAKTPAYNLRLKLSFNSAKDRSRPLRLCVGQPSLRYCKQIPVTNHLTKCPAEKIAQRRRG